MWQTLKKDKGCLYRKFYDYSLTIYKECVYVKLIRIYMLWMNWKITLVIGKMTRTSISIYCYVQSYTFWVVFISSPVEIYRSQRSYYPKNILLI